MHHAYSLRQLFSFSRGTLLAFALDTGSRDSATLTLLNPGAYTVQVKGADGGTGEAIVEVYDIP